jgi:hypothetical protein
MREVGLAFAFITFVGFYGYLVLEFYREHKRLRSYERRSNRMHAADPEIPKRALPSQTPEVDRKQALVSVGVAIGGLLGIFAEIEFLNRLLSSAH